MREKMTALLFVIPSCLRGCVPKFHEGRVYFYLFSYDLIVPSFLLLSFLFISHCIVRPKLYATWSLDYECCTAWFTVKMRVITWAFIRGGICLKKATSTLLKALFFLVSQNWRVARRYARFLF